MDKNIKNIKKGDLDKILKNKQILNEFINSDGSLIKNNEKPMSNNEITTNITTDDMVDATRQKGTGINNLSYHSLSFGSVNEQDVETTEIPEPLKNSLNNFKDILRSNNITRETFEIIVSNLHRELYG